METQVPNQREESQISEKRASMEREATYVHSHVEERQTSVEKSGKVA